MIKRRNDVTQGLQFCSLKYRLEKRKRKKKRKKKLLLHGGFQFGHPSKY